MDNLVLELRNALSDHFAKGKEENGDEGTSATQQTPKRDGNPLEVKRTVTYIVSAVVIQDGRVLMMREAKESCRGLWYLPAGRVERDETLADGVRREALEETGLIFEPTSLISVEYSTLDWFRFNFTGRITGGKLKTKAKKDKESLEAGWFTPFEVFNTLSLRARDICPIIESAINWKETKTSDPLFTTMPHRKPHSRIPYQVIVISKEKTGMKVLIDKESLMGFLEFTSQFVIPVNLVNLVQNVLGELDAGTAKKNTKVHGIMRVEHNGGPVGVADGIQLTFLVEITKSSSAAEMQSEMQSRYKWCPISDQNLCTKLKKLSEKGCIKNV